MRFAALFAALVLAACQACAAVVPLPGDPLADAICVRAALAILKTAPVVPTRHPRLRSPSPFRPVSTLPSALLEAHYIHIPCDTDTVLAPCIDAVWDVGVSVDTGHHIVDSGAPPLTFEISMFSPPPEFHNSLWAVYLSLILLSLIVKPSPYRRLFFVPVLALTFYVCCSTTGAFDSDYYLGTGWFTIFWTASDYILFIDVQRELRQVPAPASDRGGAIENASLWRRTRWGLALLNSPRGVGWAHEPTAALPAHPPADTPRLTFVAQRLWKAAQFFVLHDLCNLHIRWNDSFRPTGPEWTALGWGWRLVAAAGWALSAYSAMAIGPLLLSAASVALGASSPDEWPPLFGGPREAWSIRRFWGCALPYYPSRAWHQLMRRFVSVHGKYLAHRVLRLPPGGKPSAYVQLFTAFALSALVHYGSETLALRHWRGGALTFFMLQPCAIMVEDLLIFLARRAGFKGGVGARVVGYAWTWAWFGLTLPLWQMPLVRGGLFENGMPVSVLAGLWRGEWVLPPR
ncbi:membrane bound O-acyl transferase family-domain-containing protein [Mycena epipterygia]|nr:membrane bound O-acyl transferase family-domain-containing protein [Mycena epipterygia]